MPSKNSQNLRCICGRNREGMPFDKKQTIMGGILATLFSIVLLLRLLPTALELAVLLCILLEVGIVALFYVLRKKHTPICAIRIAVLKTFQAIAIPI